MYKENNFDKLEFDEILHYHKIIIAPTDREIDQLVYQLYGLTDEEMRIVEGE